MTRNGIGSLAAAALAAAALGLAAVGCDVLRPPTAPRSEWSALAARLDAMVRAEMGEKAIPGFALALIDDGRTAWAQAWGVEDAARGVPASLKTVWRAGSVSKMFTDLAVIRLVEQGRLELDAPVTWFLPEFAPRNPFGGEITLRQLMAHRSGLVREPPVGNYFDPGGPSLAQTVASLNGTELVYAPGSRTKYSNAGIAVVGRVLEVVAGRLFAEVVRTDVLLPMGLVEAAFERTPLVTAHLADAQMWTYWGTTFPAPTFELGMAPAGSLYCNVRELARAVEVFQRGGAGARGPIVREDSLAEMWRPQFAEPGATGGFGLGFHVDRFEETRRVGHGGAIYGFSTVLQMLPDEKLGVVAIASKDVAQGTVQKIADHALRSMLGHRRAVLPSPLPPPLVEIGGERARRLAGSYRSADGSKRVRLIEQGGELWLDHLSRRARVRARGPKLIADDLVFSGPELEVVREGELLRFDGAELSREPSPRPPPPPAELLGLIGEYGFDHNVLYVFEEGGELHALIEWFFDYPLTRAGEDVFAFPDHGLYFGERIVFERGPDGRATRAIAAGVGFDRRSDPGSAGGTFRIDPVRPIDELRAAALAARPPREQGKLPPDLVDLAPLDPRLHFDVRYATTENFLSTVFYEQPRAFLQRPAAQALLAAQGKLADHGFGLLIHDAYRPWHVTKMFFDATPPKHHDMVADPAKGSRHNRGCAVDLTLYDLATGEPVVMPSGYDEFSTRANPWYPGGTSEQRWLRELLRHAMESSGFTVYEHEWWHFDYEAWREYPILNSPFEALSEPAGG